jgi:hypothetical protein
MHASAAPEIVCAYHVPHVPPFPLQAESNAAVNKAKNTRDLGGRLHIGVRNSDAQLRALRDLRWAGKSLAEHQAEYGLIWHRLEPAAVPPGGEAELTLCLRQRLREKTALTITWDDGAQSTCSIVPEAPALSFQGIAFARGRKQAWLYVHAGAGELSLTRNGLPQRVRVLNAEPVDGIRVLQAEFEVPVERGSVQAFRLRSAAGEQCVAAIRAFDQLSIFGSYGGARYERFADNGLSGYASFGKVGKDALDGAAAMGIRSALTVGKTPPPATIGHPGLYAYILMDEPDCKDYGVKDRPMKVRLGAHAPQMLDYVASCRAADPVTPTLLTVDLTFTPGNYFVYGPIADIVNPDCYAITVGWPIRVTRNYTGVLRAACAPRPFTFTYQSSWEEFAKADKSYVGAAEVRAKGWDAFRDKSRTRGLGRAPSVEEIRLGMLYAVGSGAKGLFGYIDATEICGSLMFHGSEDLPEVWRTVGEMSRRLRSVGPLIEVSHPVAHARTTRAKTWLRTLLVGDSAALVVAVNEDYDSVSKGFAIRPAEGMPFGFADLPWLQANAVGRVEPDGIKPLACRRQGDGLAWTDDVHDGAVYVVAANDGALGTMDRQAKATAVAQVQGIAKAKAMRDRRAQVEAEKVKALLALPAEGRLRGTPVTGYGWSDKGFWNPWNEKLNTVDFWEKKGTKPLGVAWTAKVLAKSTQDFCWQGRLYGGKVSLQVTDAAGKVLLDRALRDVRHARLRREEVTFPAPGTYGIAVVVQPDKPHEHGGRIAVAAFLAPSEK